MSTHSKGRSLRSAPIPPTRRSRRAPLSLVMLGLSAPSFAIPGDLDPTFNPDGIAGFDLIDIPPGAPDEARAVVTQPDGKIVVAGYALIEGDDDFALLRYNPDGNLDPSFGFNGIVTTHFGNLTDGVIRGAMSGSMRSCCNPMASWWRRVLRISSRPTV